MGETFYAALGVSEDATGEEVERAYRERVKQAHPDVSDDPDASERFKRLTTARDVLVDAEKRARYDELGHEAYVRAHTGGDWTAGVSGDPPGAAAATASEGGSRGRTPPTERAAWLGAEDRSAGTGDHTEKAGQAAGGSYAHVKTEIEDGSATTRRLWTGVRRIGPWLPFHGMFIGGALATGWFVYSGAVELELSVPGLIVGLLVLVFAVSASALHLLSRLYV